MDLLRDAIARIAKNQEWDKYSKSNDTNSENISIEITYPPKFISDTSDLKRKLPKIPFDGIERSVKKMGVRVKLTPVENVSLSEPLTQMDLLVYMGICSWIDKGIGNDDHDIAPEKRYFSSTMIYRCINPTERKDLTPDSPEVKEVEKSIDKMCSINMTVNYDNFFTGKDKQTLVKKCNFSDRFISAAKIEATVNGHPMIIYKLRAVPPMYWASKQGVNQLASYERTLLEAPALKDTSGSATIALLKHDILTHIQTLKHNNGQKLNRKIKYSTIFERNGITIKDKHERKRRRDQIKKYLDVLIQKGEIKGYAEYKEGREFIGIEFKL